MPMIGIPFMGSGIFPLLVTIFWIWMLIDCLLNKKMSGGSKICWFLFILLTNLVGATIYFFVECQHRNPIEALGYYVRSFSQATRPTPTPPPYTRPVRPAPPVYTPSASIYSDYAGGYRAREQAWPAASSTQAEERPFSQPTSEQPEYEQTIISYPEMPPPQQS